MRLQLDWPDVTSFPGYGMVRARQDLDEVLARHAASSGAELLEGRNVSEPVRDESGRIVGVVAKVVDERGRATGETETYRAPVVVAADGVSSRLSVKMGREKREDRPMAVAVRAYYETPATTTSTSRATSSCGRRRPKGAHPHAGLRLALRPG